MSLNMATVRSILILLIWWSCLAPAWAVQFGAGTGSTYPTTLDSTNPRTNKSGVACNSAVTSNACAEHINDLQDAAVKTETELGVLPKGTSATVKERIVGIRSLSGATPDTIVISADQVGIGTATPTAFALLDLASTTKAFLIPRMTSAQKTVLTAADGMMVYDITLGQYQFRQGGAWVGLSSAAAPDNAGYWVDTANGTLTAERNLGALTTGLVLNTVTAGVGVPSAYAGTLCTNQFPRSLNASAAATCASVSLTADVTGILPIANGGTGQTTAQAAINALSAVAGATNEHVLTKDTATGNAIFKAAAGGGGGITVLNRDVIEAEVVNTITETTVYSYSVAGGTLGTSGALRLTVLGDHLNNSGAGVVTTIRAKFGGTTIGGQGPSHTTSASRRAIKIIVEIVAANATNAQRASVHIMWGDTTGVAGDLSGMGNNGLSAHSSLALNSTAAQTLSVTVEHASAAATISTIARTAILESL